MKVQTRLSLFSSILFAIVFAILSILIYSLYYNNAEKSIYENLTKTSYVTALFYLEEDELNSQEFDLVRTEFEELNTNTFYQVYNEQNEISYCSEKTPIPTKILDDIRSKKRLTFTEDGFFCHGIFYKDNQGDFVVIAKEKKELLNEQMSSLMWILATSFLISLIIIIILCRWIAHIAYRPFSHVISQVKNISTNDLDMQIESPNTKDELQDLIDTFNVLLGKISETFVIQKNFVNYVSHEFKTPLASILGNLEVFSLKDRNPEEYQQLSKKLIQQIYQLEEILNTLLIISDLGDNKDLNTQVRVDEMTWEIIDNLTRTYSNAKIAVQIDIEPEDELMLSVTKDRTQLLMAMYNIIENAVKYSRNNQVKIHLFKREGKLLLSITDKGIGIPPEKLENIGKPFYRGENTYAIEGNGIGLSIALRILEKNDIKYEISSEVNVGTTVILIF